jgi:ribosome maturation factor RimP
MFGQRNALIEKLKPVISGLGCELWGVEQIAGQGRALLRIYIDNAAGISLADCERVSRGVAGLLESEQPVRGSYDLEVSSPGLDRPLFSLDQFRLYPGREVRIRLGARLNGRRQIAGRIDEIGSDSVTVIVGAERLQIPADLIGKARLVPEG